MMHISQECAQCESQTKCRRRDFSAQTWSVLLTWGEVERHAVDQPICDDCYNDLRDILIDRANDVATVVAKPDALNNLPSSKETAGSKKSASAKKKATKTTKKKKSSKVA